MEKPPEIKTLLVSREKLYALAKVKESTFRIYMTQSNPDKRRAYIKDLLVHSGIAIDQVLPLEIKNAANMVSVFKIKTQNIWQ